MAQTPRQTTAISALRLLPPAGYQGTPQTWRVLCEAIWPAARTSESIMLALSYCSARHLDPFRRPVHIVPVWNSVLRREVETVWPGISELLTTASRSKEFAGVDEPQWGPDETRTFKGTDREGHSISATVTFPVWASITVWRRVSGERVPFTAPVYWIEAYGRQAFRSELPNVMWEKRPRGQLHKCALAAALRLGFPEDIGSDYAAEEMEGREIGSGGVVIDAGRVEPPTPPTDQDRQADGAYGGKLEPPGEAVRPLAGLDEQNSTQWLRNLQNLVASVQSEDELGQIAQHPRVVTALTKAATMIRSQINDWLRDAHARLAPPINEPPPSDEPPPGSPDDWPDDPIRDLVAEITAMDQDALDTLPTSKAWAVKVRDLFPPDEDRIRDAIETRKAVLRAERRTQ